MSDELAKVFVEQLTGLRSEVQQGFAAMTARLDETNARLDETRTIQEHTLQRLDHFQDRTINKLDSSDGFSWIVTIAITNSISESKF